MPGFDRCPFCPAIPYSAEKVSGFPEKAGNKFPKSFNNKVAQEFTHFRRWRALKHVAEARLTFTHPIMKLPRTLLIVDDEPDICNVLGKKLRSHFSSVEVAYSLTDGLEKAAQLRPDVIILDNNLPDGHGLECIGHFKNAGSSVYLILISAMDIKQQALEAGADEFIGKPFIGSDLVGLA